MTSNQIAYWVNEEKKRSNLAMERENLRHNLEQEKIGRSQAAASYLGAQAAMQNAATNAANLVELQRHNQASEATSAYGTVASSLVAQQDSETRRKQLELEAQMQPYKKFSQIASGIGNIVGAFTGATKTFDSIANQLLNDGGKK